MSKGFHSGKPGFFIMGLRDHNKRDPYRRKKQRDFFRDG